MHALLKALNGLADASKFGKSFRPVQPLNARKVYLGQSPDGIPVLSLTFPPSNLDSFTGNVSLDIPSTEPIDYDYTDGPVGIANWGDVNEICATGVEQSPINIVASAVADGVASPLELNYNAVNFSVKNTGKTLLFDMTGAGTMTVAGSTFNLLQFHVHYFSEHRFNGGAFPLEFHFVHADENGNLAVVGVMVSAGGNNAALDQTMEGFEDIFTKMLPNDKGVTHSFPMPLSNLMAIFPNDLTYYHYMGSLTTPPCSEGVRWHVLRQPIYMTQKGINGIINTLKALKYASIEGYSFRPPQPLNDRIVTLGYPESSIVPDITFSVIFLFEYFKATVAEQNAFTSGFISHLAEVLLVPENSVRITNLQQGSTIVTASVTPPPGREAAIEGVLAFPEDVFSAAAGWDENTYGSGKTAPATTSPSSDEDDTGFSNDAVAAIIALLVLIPVIIVVNILYCTFCLNNKPEIPVDSFTKKNMEKYKRRKSAAFSTVGSVAVMSVLESKGDEKVIKHEAA